MASKTAQLASETVDEIAASYRPVLVPVAEGPRTYFNEDPHGLTLRINIQNAGTGPAAFIRAWHDPTGDAADNWSLGSLSPGEASELVFRVSSHVGMSQVLLDYRDLTGRTYSTAIVLEHPETNAENIRVYDVQFGTDTPFTPGRDSVPQPGLERLPIHDE